MRIEANNGEWITNYVDRCLFVAKNKQVSHIDACFNEIEFTIYPDSYIQDICEKYDLLCKIRRLERD